MKTCEVYKTPKNYIIITESTSDIGLGISDDPIYVIPIDSTINELQEKVFDCLNSSRVGVYTPNRDEWASWQKKQLEKMQQKSFVMLYKNSNSCHLALENNIITIYPYKYYDPSKPKQGLCAVEEAEVKIDLNNIDKDEIIKILVDMLNVSYK